MDRLIYTAMTGAKATMAQQAGVANNMANVATTGFRAEMHRLRAVDLTAPDTLDTRSFAVNASIASDLSSGPLVQTGRAYDVAIKGEGWFAVQTADGGEAYTRDGSFEADANGILRTRNGLQVAGDGGAITIPPDSRIEVGVDGTLTAVPTTGTRTAGSAIGRLKLVNPPAQQMQRGDDGLFRVVGGAPAGVDEKVRLAGGYLESSNVNIVEQMTSLIELSRRFDMQVKLLETAKEDDRAATQLLSRT